MKKTAASQRARSERQKKDAMVAALAETGNVTLAGRLAKVGRTSHYEWLKDDESYAAAVRDALDQAIELLEGEAKRRGFDGVKKPVYQGGKRVGYIQEYSDTLLIFLLKGARPEKYRERHEVTGKDGAPFKIVISESDAML